MTSSNDLAINTGLTFRFYLTFKSQFDWLSHWIGGVMNILIAIIDNTTYLLVLSIEENDKKKHRSFCICNFIFIFLQDVDQSALSCGKDTCHASGCCHSKF